MRVYLSFSLAFLGRYLQIVGERAPPTARVGIGSTSDASYRPVRSRFATQLAFIRYELLTCFAQETSRENLRQS